MMETFSSGSDVPRGMVEVVESPLQTSLKSQEYLRIGGREEDENFIFTSSDLIPGFNQPTSSSPPKL